jgi:hypothetical protein
VKQLVWVINGLTLDFIQQLFAKFLKIEKLNWMGIKPVS